jgi:protein-disulfide isomerase
MDENKNTNIDFGFVKKNLEVITLIFSLVAIFIGIYNSYQIRNIGSIPTQNNGGALLSADGLLKEIPKNAPFLGNPNAKLTVVEFADYQCPFCGRFFKETFPELKKNYIDTGKIKFVYMDFAFLGEESIDAANSAYCANEQGKFWEFHDKLYSSQNGENQGTFSVLKLEKIAMNLGLNMADYRSCVSGGKYKELIDNNRTLGTKYGVKGTPGFFIGSQFINGAAPYQNFADAIEAGLK